MSFVGRRTSTQSKNRSLTRENPRRLADSEITGATGELSTEPPCRQRLARSGRPIDRDRRREIALGGAGQDPRQCLFSIGSGNDLLGLGQRIEQALVGEHRVVGEDVVEEAII